MRKSSSNRVSKSKKRRTTSASSKRPKALRHTKAPRTLSVKPIPDAKYSKQNRVVAMLSAASGATVAAIMQQTGWQQHSVRGFLAGVVRKRLKLKLVSDKIDGQRIYRIMTDTSASARSSQSGSPSV
jgi:hypothetical protein